MPDPPPFKPPIGPDVPAAGQDDPPRLALRPRDAARALGISERSLWSLTAQGLVPHVKMGRLVLYPVEALRDWLGEQARKEGGGR